MSIEDFSSSKEFRIFKNYDSFNKSFFELGAIIQISAIIQKNYYNDDLSVNIGEIQFLDREWKVISVKLELDNFDDHILQNLEKTIKDNKGKISLEINMYLSEKNIFVPFRCNNYQVNYSEKFKKEMSKIGISEYFLN